MISDEIFWESVLNGWIKIAALVVAVAMSCVACARAQEVAGDWHGTLAVPSGELRIGVTITSKAGGGYEASLDSPDQGASGIPLDEVKVESGTLSFSVQRIGATYKAQWDPARKAWVGEWRQGATFPLILMVGRPEALQVIAGLDGDWVAEIPLPDGVKLRRVLHVRTGQSGTVVTMDSPDQLVYGLPIRSLTRNGQTVRFTLAGGVVGFEGTLAADGQTIAGEWSGRGYKGPLTFTGRQVQASGPRRPEAPQPPFPYRTEEVVVDSAPGVKLSGTLSLPQGKGPFPAVVMITGAGAQDRDETIFGHKPFAVIADRLTRDGIAVLRVDDRGFAQSTGDFATATDDDFAIDAEANAAFLRQRPDIDPRRIGLIGHSEGGLVAPKVAVNDPKIAFIVLMAGPGAPPLEAARAERARLLPAMGLTAEQITASNNIIDHAVFAMRGAKDEAEAKARALRAIKDEGGGVIGSDAEADLLATQLSSGWLRDLLDYDPRPTLAKVKCPILALNGSKDGQVVADLNLAAIRTATKANPDVTVIELPNLNHMFQTAKTGTIAEYAEIEETVAPVALDAMSSWIRQHVMR